MGRAVMIFGKKVVASDGEEKSGSSNPAAIPTTDSESIINSPSKDISEMTSSGDENWRACLDEGRDLCDVWKSGDGKYIQF